MRSTMLGCRWPPPRRDANTSASGVATVVAFRSNVNSSWMRPVRSRTASSRGRPAGNDARAYDSTLPADRDRVAEISSDVWDGHDYIPRVFDDWVADAGSTFQAGQRHVVRQQGGGFGRYRVAPVGERLQHVQVNRPARLKLLVLDFHVDLGRGPGRDAGYEDPHAQLSTLKAQLSALNYQFDAKEFTQES